MKNLHPIDLLAISVLSLVCLAAILTGLSFPPIRAIAGILLVLVLPGYAFFTALFPDRSIASAENLLIAAGLSIFLTMAASAGLFVAHRPLQVSSWALVLTGLVLVGSLVAFLRRHGRYVPVPWPSLARFRWQPAVLVALAVVLAAGAIGLVSSPITNPSRLQGYSILWILPGQKTAPGSIRVGVVSDEFQPTTYNLVLTENGQIMNSWQNIFLAPGQTWQANYQGSAYLPVTTPVQAFLYKTNSPNVIYRQVKLSSGQ